MRPQTPRTHRTGGRRFLVRISSELKVLKVLTDFRFPPTFRYTLDSPLTLLPVITAETALRCECSRCERLTFIRAAELTREINRQAYVRLRRRACARLTSYPSSTQAASSGRPPSHSGSAPSTPPTNGASAPRSATNGSAPRASAWACRPCGRPARPSCAGRRQSRPPPRAS